MKILKIAILVEIINYHSGARAPLEIAKHLTQLGHKVIVYGYDSNQDKTAIVDLLKHKVEVIIIKKNAFPIIGKYFAIFPLFKQIKNNPPNIICFAGTLPFFLAGKLCGIPIILTYYGSQMDAYLEKKIPGEFPAIKDRLINLLANCYIYCANFLLIRLSARVVAISKFSSDEAKKFYGRTPDKIIYLGATHLPYKNINVEKNPKSIKLLSVSRITPYKGFHLLIEALNTIQGNKKALLTIAGSQSQKRYLKYLKKIGKGNLQLFLNPSDDILAKLYQESDFYINADKYLYFGLPIYEAANFGKSAVSLNLGAAKELIQHGKTGFIAENPTEFSYYLQKLITDEKLRKKLGYNALQSSKKFSWETCAAQWEKLLFKYAKKES